MVAINQLPATGPGKCLAYHWHKHDDDEEFFFCLEGEFLPYDFASVGTGLVWYVKGAPAEGHSLRQVRPGVPTVALSWGLAGELVSLAYLCGARGLFP